MTCKTHVDDVGRILADIGDVGVAKALEAAIIFEDIEEGCAGGGSHHVAKPVSRECAVKPVLTERRVFIVARPVRSRQTADGNRAATDRSIQGRVFVKSKPAFSLLAASSTFPVGLAAVPPRIVWRLALGLRNVWVLLEL